MTFGHCLKANHLELSRFNLSVYLNKTLQIFIGTQLNAC